MTIESDDEEEELQCQVCLEDEHAVMYGKDQRAYRKKVQMKEDPEIR